MISLPTVPLATFPRRNPDQGPVLRRSKAGPLLQPPFAVATIGSAPPSWLPVPCSFPRRHPDRDCLPRSVAPTPRAPVASAAGGTASQSVPCEDARTASLHLCAIAFRLLPCRSNSASLRQGL